jgi:hypothetical protein
MSACCLRNAGFFLNPEDGSSTFLRNVGEFLSDYTALHPKRQNSPGFIVFVR